MVVVAHPDDDLLFLNPDLLKDVRIGRCVRSIFLTSGDAGGAVSWAAQREAGVQATYASMAGVANSWTISTAQMSGHTIRLATLDALPQISMAFLRLPDGNFTGGGYASTNYQSLSRLWANDISTISAVDGSNSYTRESLISALSAFMSTMQPAVIRTSDFVSELNVNTDHPDHHAAAVFTQAAATAWPGLRSLVAYEDYSVANRAANVSGSDLTAKEAALAIYSTYDPGVNGFEYAYDKQYTIASVTGGGTPTVNHAPVADAGADQAVLPGVTVQLDGWGSSDQDGNGLTFQWTQTAGTPVSLANPTAARTTFTAPTQGTSVTLSLVVNDGTTNSVADSVTVSVPAPSGDNLARSG